MYVDTRYSYMQHPDLSLYIPLVLPTHNITFTRLTPRRAMCEPLTPSCPLRLLARAHRVPTVSENDREKVSVTIGQRFIVGIS